MIDLPPLQIGLLLAAIGVVAFLYSSVGHGGATGYLAVTALMGIAPGLARPGALWINCFVASIAFWRFNRAGFFDYRVFLPLASLSIPMAWLGSRMHLTGRAYAMVLGMTLFAAGFFLGVAPREQKSGEGRMVNLPLMVLIGGGLGFLAGATGIGGGVFLTPFLIFARMVPPKTAGGISALFIVVNSIAGLVGLGQKALIWQPSFTLALAVAVMGALSGAYLSINRWSTTTFRRVLGFVLWIAAAKLLLTGK